MNTIYRLTTLFALTLSALGADVKFSALPTATSPSTNSYIPIIDLNLLPAAQNEKYLLTNLATVAQLSSSTNSLTNSFVLKTGDTMTGPLLFTNTGVGTLDFHNYGQLGPTNGYFVPVGIYRVGSWMDIFSNETNATDFSSWGQYNSSYPTLDLEYGTEGFVFHVMPAGGGVATSSDDKVMMALRPNNPRSSSGLLPYFGHIQLMSGLFAEQSTNKTYWNPLDNSSNTPFEYFRKSTPSGSWPQFVYDVSSGDGYGMWSMWRKARGTLSAPTATQSGDKAMDQSAWAYTGLDWGYLGDFTFEADGTSSSGSTPGRFVVYTTPSGAVNPVERLRVSANGTVSVSSNLTVAATATVGELLSSSLGVARTSLSMTGTNLIVDFGLTNRFVTCTLTGTVVNVLFTNVTAGKNWNAWLVMPTNNVTPTFPFTGTLSNWFGGAPATLTANTIGSLSFYPRDTTTNAVVAAYSQTQ